MPRPEKVRLGEILVQQKLLTEDQLLTALAQQKKTGRRLGRVFVEGGFVTEDEIASALARQLKVPYVNLKVFDTRSEVVNLLPETIARRFRAIVLEDLGSALRVGMADPTDLNAYDEMTRLLRRDISLAVVSETVLLQVIDRLYRRTHEISGLAQELQNELAGSPAVDFGTLGTTLSVEEAPVAKLLQSVFEDAVSVRASDIHIEPMESRLQIRFRIDGVLHLQTESDLRIASALVLRLKLMAGLDISEKRLPQDGRFNVRVRNYSVDVRMSSMPTQHGESMVMRLLTQASGLLGLDHIGMPPDMLAKLKHVLHRPSGMVLVTGPTGSGKSTTLAAMVNHLNENEYGHVLTVEDPIEFVHESKKCLINQREVGPHTLSFNNALRSALREDPDAILVGELRDLETIRLALTASETGHLVFGTLHTSSAAKTIDRVVDVFPAAEKEMVRSMLSESLVAVISQTLCKLKDGSGRAAAHEIMLGTSAIKNLIRENKIAQMYSSIQTGQNLGMQTLDQNLADLVRRNLISPAEARAKAKIPENFPG
jgi:MSHA biogenesis protein MshE